MRRWITIAIICTMCIQPLYAQELRTVSEFSALKRTPSADKIEDGAHSEFTNLWISEGNLQSVKGRNRLNDTANVDVVTNMLCYYENAAGTTKKLIVRESDEVVSYDLDWTGRTSLVSGLANEQGDCQQIGDTLYFTSSTDGLHKWTGSGSATAITAVATPASVNFTVTTGDGGLTPGLPISILPDLIVDATCNIICDGVSTVVNSCLRMGTPSIVGEEDVTSSVNTLEQAATTTIYQYKVTSRNSTTGIEGEPSSADSATLTGDDTFTWAATSCIICDQSSGDPTCDDQCCTNLDFVTTGAETRTTGTLVAPSDPYNETCIYRTVAGGDEYFQAGCAQAGAFTDSKADVSLSGALDTTIDTIAPPSFRYIAEYKGRLFLAEGTDINFTRIPVDLTTDADKYWLETDQVQTGGIKPITGLHTTANSLLVFTENRVIELSNSSSTILNKNVLLEGIGTVADETIETDTNGDVIFFAGVQGVYKTRTFQQLTDDVTGAAVDQPRTRLVKISAPDLDVVFRGEDSNVVLDPADYPTSHAYYDSDRDLYFLFIGDDCLLFNNATLDWSYIPGSAFIKSVYRKSPNALGVGVMQDDLGFAWDNWIGYENGIESGTVTGSVTSSTSTAVTDSTATFNTTNDGLEAIWMYIDNETPEYRRITSNTATTFTVSPAFTTTPIGGDEYFIAYIKIDMRTKIYSMDAPPKFSTNADFWLFFNPAAASQKLDVFGFADKSTTATRAAEIDLNNSDRFEHLTIPLRSYWLQFGMRGFIYDISESIDSPIDIISYSFEGTIENQ